MAVLRRTARGLTRMRGSANIVLIPCWRRADFLSVTLRRIARAEKAHRQYYVFLIDEGHSDEVMRVARQFPFASEIVANELRPMRGNSFNILNGFAYARRIAPSMKSRLVYLIEEDIWIGRDFFTFHEAVQSRFNCFFVSAVRNQNDARTFPPRRSLVYFHHAYQSLGVSFRVEALDAIVRHHRPNFYADPAAYAAQHFPNSSLAAGFVEQDGLIHRIVEKGHLRGAYPFVPRAYHAGFVGYNRPGHAFGGTLPERIAKLERLTDAEANRRALLFGDIQRCDLDKRHAPSISLARDAP